MDLNKIKIPKLREICASLVNDDMTSSTPHEYSDLRNKMIELKNMEHEMGGTDIANYTVMYTFALEKNYKYSMDKHSYIMGSIKFNKETKKYY